MDFAISVVIMTTWCGAVGFLCGYMFYRRANDLYTKTEAMLDKRARYTAMLIEAQELWEYGAKDEAKQLVQDALKYITTDAR